MNENEEIPFIFIFCKEKKTHTYIKLTSSTCARTAQKEKGTMNELKTKLNKTEIVTKRGKKNKVQSSFRTAIKPHNVSCSREKIKKKSVEANANYFPFFFFCFTKAEQ